MSHRFFVEPPIERDAVRLTGSEARHLATVMRAKVGSQVVLFDGSGTEFFARVDQIGRRHVELSIESRQMVDRELPFELTLGVALPKGDRQRWLIEKAAELGVARFVPLATTRGVAQPTAQAIKRLRVAVIQASKQCGRNRLMKVCEPKNFPDYVAQTERSQCRLLAHPRGFGNTFSSGPANPTSLAIGPEGGFTEEEIQQAQTAGWQIISLGSRFLRSETAAIALVSLLALQ